MAKDAASAALLKKRTLTNLDNEMPTWLKNAHRKLDEAVFAADGWPPDISDDDLLARLLELNLARAAEEVAAGEYGARPDETYPIVPAIDGGFAANPPSMAGTIGPQKGQAARDRSRRCLGRYNPNGSRFPFVRVFPGEFDMSFTGTIHNGVVVFDSGSPLPAEGTRVEVVVQEQAVRTPTLRERLAKLAGTVDDLPSDMARNHDHYIHGAPKK